MNIEDLSKTQLLLLTILVNFVTSIATGVLTVSLLDQAPAPVTQTVNQIVDHTIQTVSAPITLPAPKPVPATPSTEDLLTSAIAAASARQVTIYAGTSTTSPLAIGTYLPKAHAVAAATGAGMPKEVTIQFPDGSTAAASLSRAGATVTIYGFADAATLPQAPAPSLVARTDLKQGQTVIALTSDRAAATGIISKVDDTGIQTSLPATPAGTAAVNLSGNIIGISSGVPGLYLSADRISTLLNATSTPAS